ncbi:MAG: TonB-dependent receptor, partial [Ignavibacteria bacterium]|nr:TonB-dependent receptor [Ignavibacteria bacterium]
NRKRASAAIGAEFMPIEQIKANINIRNDMVDGSSKGINPSVELMYQPAFLPNFGFSFGYSKNLRFPSMNDLFWYPGGNEFLKPEKSLTAETAINWAPKVDFGILSLNISGFYSNINDWILWQPTNFRYWSPENIANVLARGIEVHQNLNFVYQKWRIQTTVNYIFTVTTDESQTAQNENTDGKQLMYIPLHHANGFVKAIYNMYYTTYNVDYTGVRNTNFDADSYIFSQLPAYWLHHFSIGVQTKSWDIALKINNIFNKSYQAVLWRPMPGRNFELLVQYQITKR